MPFVLLRRISPLSLLLLPRRAFPQPAFRDVNLLVVTDAHGWIASHAHPDHSPNLNANFADVADAVRHVRTAASAVGKDVFFLNDGDHTEGSGISDATEYTSGVHGSELFPLLQRMPFDALTIGNHELYLDSTIEFMLDSGFVDSWNGNYVTSNVFDADTSDPIGSKYTVLVGPNSGIELLVFGFLYHMTNGCQSVFVEDPKDTVSSDWFVEALTSNSDVDAIVVLTHADLVDTTVYAIQKGIRNVLPRTPLQFITGHTHYRGFKKLDGRTSTFEAGHYADTLGWLSFDIDGTDADDGISFEHEFVDANVEALRNFAGVSKDDFRTEEGRAIESAMNAVIEKLDLNRVLGCSPRTYSPGAVLTSPESLHELYVNSVLPTSVFDVPTGTTNEPLYIMSSGGLRYSVYEGQFTYGDVFAVAPFSSKFRYYPGLGGGKVVALMKHLNDARDVDLDGSLAPRSLRRFPKVPPFVAGPKNARPDVVYDVFYDDFDAPKLQRGIAAILNRDVKEVKRSVVRWRDDAARDDYVDTTTCWVEAAPKLWPCDNDGRNDAVVPALSAQASS